MALLPQSRHEEGNPKDGFSESVLEWFSRKFSRISGLIVVKGIHDPDARDKGDTGSPWHAVTKQLLKLPPIIPVSAYRKQGFG